MHRARTFLKIKQLRIWIKSVVISLSTVEIKYCSKEPADCIQGIDEACFGEIAVPVMLY